MKKIYLQNFSGTSKNIEFGMREIIYLLNYFTTKCIFSVF